MNIRKTILLITASALLVTCGVRAGLISANFDDSDSAWSTTTGTAAMAAANLAIADWTSKLALPTGQDVNINFVLTNTNSSMVGIANWVGVAEYDTTTSSLPWGANVSHTIYINPNLVSFSLTGPTTGYYDGLSVFRHEIGHALGFADEFFYGTNNDDLWTTSITNGIFTENSLNVAMTSTSDLSHVAVVSGVNDAMVTSLSTGIRYDITSNDVAMLSAAYGYTLVPEPASILVLLGGSALVLLRRPKNPRVKPADFHL